MKDRNVQYPHRYQLVPVAGQDGVYDIIAKPGTITEPGTPINKANLLSDTTANLYGLSGDDAVVDKALASAFSKNISYNSVLATDNECTVNVLTDILSLSLPKGTYFIYAQCSAIKNQNSAMQLYARLYDGSNTLSTGLATQYVIDQYFPGQILLSTIVTLTDTKTIKMQVYSMGTASTVVAAPTLVNGFDAGATQISAIKIG